MKIQTVSVKDLVKDGFKEREDCWYVGDSRYPTISIKKGLEHLLGRSMELVGVDENRVRVESQGEEYWIPIRIVKTKIPKRKVHKLIVGDNIAKFNGFNFEFPCRMSSISPKEAARVAKWVLKVTKQ